MSIISLISIESFGKATVSGYVRNAATGEALIAANVIIEELGTGTSTNEYGFYALSLEPGNYTLIFSYVGYATVRKNIVLSDEMVLNMELNELLQQLEEVTISSQRNNMNITEVETGVTRLDIQSIRKIPAFMGEVDVIKAISYFLASRSPVKVHQDLVSGEGGATRISFCWTNRPSIMPVTSWVSSPFSTTMPLRMLNSIKEIYLHAPEAGWHPYWMFE